MDAFRRNLALLGALSICALGSACASAAGPGRVANDDVPPLAQAGAGQPVAPSAAISSDAPSYSTELAGAHAGSGSVAHMDEPVDADEPELSSPPTTNLVAVSALQAAEYDLPPVSAPRVFGPEDGGIYHDPSNAASMRVLVGANSADLVLSANVSNPFDPSRRQYDHGFLIRVGSGRYHGVVLASDGTWRHYVSNGSSVTLKRSGAAASANLERGDSNSLALVATGRTGWLFINGGLAATLDLAENLQAGDAGLVANLASRVDVLGAQTTYEALTVGGVVPIETAGSGVLPHNPAGRAGGESISPSASLAAEVDFAVPYRAGDGDWSFGLVLECADGSTHQFSFNDRALWRLVSTPPSPGEVVVTGFGPTHQASFEPETNNRLTLVHLQGEWRIFLNGEFLALVEISDDAVPVSLAMVAGVEPGEQAPGSDSTYSDFRAFALGN